MVELLIREGANVNHADRDGTTALDLATSKGNILHINLGSL